MNNCCNSNKIKEITEVFYLENWEVVSEKITCNNCHAVFQIKDYKYAFYDWKKSTKFRTYTEEYK